MGKVYDSIDDSLRTFIERQKMFFVATAPLDGEGLVNLSPKGYDAFRILGPTTVAYLDLGGSGIETLAHVRENGRLVIMFCEFEGAPNIVRLHGKAEAFEQGDAEYDELIQLFPDMPGARSVIRLEAHRISDSCGFGVPRYAFTGERDTLIRYHEKLDPEQHRAKMLKNNAQSLDGLPGLRG